MYERANVVFSVMISLFQGYCLHYFFGSFLESREPLVKCDAGVFSRSLCEDKHWKGLIVAVLYGASRLILSRIESPVIWDYRISVCKMVLSLCMISAFTICFYKSFHLITIFLVVSFQAIMDISHYTVVIALGEMGGFLLDLWNWCVGNGIITSEKVFGIVANAGIIVEWLVEYPAIMLLMYLSLKMIVTDFREKKHDINRTELMFILTPAAVGLMICMLLRIIIITVEDSIPKILYDKYPVLTVVLPAILLLSLLSILYGVRLFQNMICWNRERSSRIILTKQVAGLQEHIEEIERVYSGIRSMKHDMKNTISVIRRLYMENGSEENEELQAYLSELNRSFEKLDIRFNTGNTIVDTLLNMKYHEAMREVPGLKMDADKLLLPKHLEIRSYDIGIILGNALDNAIEACGKLKEKEPEAKVFICLSSMRKGNLLILKTENSFDGKLIRKGREEILATDKADKESHGIGLANIKNTAEKYQGTMDFRAEGKVFILSVMIKNEGISDEKND